MKALRHSWALPLAVFVALAAWPSSARAEEAEPWLPNAGLEVLKFQEEVDDVRSSIMLYARFSAIAGEVDSGLDVDYGDIFGAGFGFQLEGSMLWKMDEWYIGGFIAIGVDSYDGEKEADDIGDTLEPDELDITNFLVGIKGHLTFGRGFYWDVHAGIGIARWSAVDGTLVIAGVPIDVDVFESTTVFAFDLGTRIGFTTGAFIVDAGFGFRFFGAPDDADLSFSSSTAATASFEIGVGVAF